MRVFVDTSAWFAAANAKDRHHRRASELLDADLDFVTSTFIVVEAWRLLLGKLDFATAESFVERVASGAVTLEPTTMGDFHRARHLTAGFEDQEFSLVDRTSFAMMERLGIGKVISFDDDFLIYRFGANRDRAFEVLR
jgi:predicted nucleic acid-binding protein